MLEWGKRVLKRTPLLGPLLSRLGHWRRVRALKARSAKEVFTDIFRRNGWRGQESVSGTGSDPTQTSQIIAALPALFAEYQIRSLLDIPCGDFHWMRSVNLRGISYLGADVVQDLIAHNQQYGTDGIAFQQLNLLEGPLPKVDLIFCRDCLVHFSFDDIFRALHNISASGSQYILTTTFPARTGNASIVTGEWRPLNLEQAPFQFPPPLKMITEGCTEKDGSYADKSLGLWKVSELKACRIEKEITSAPGSSGAGKST